MLPLDMPWTDESIPSSAGVLETKETEATERASLRYLCCLLFILPRDSLRNDKFTHAISAIAIGKVLLRRSLAR